MSYSGCGMNGLISSTRADLNILAMMNRKLLLLISASTVY